MPLTNLSVKNAKPAGKAKKLFDERGLYLLVSPSGSKLWQFKFRIHSKEKKLSLGAYPDVSFAQARELRDEARKLVVKGVDPVQSRRQLALEAKHSQSQTFSVVANELLAKRVKDGISESTKAKADWLFSLLEPAIGNRPVADISAMELLDVLRSIELTGRAETTRRLRSFASRVFRYAEITGRADRNPALALQGALIVPQVRHHPAILDLDGLRDLLRAIDKYNGYPSTVGALRLTPHVFQRPGEIRTMRWADLDLARSRWIIPAERMKMRRVHEVPLSRQAKHIIQGMIASAGNSEFVFPAFHTWRKPLSENGVNQALRRLGYHGKMTAHGFRSTASSLLNESGRWSIDAIERALAHKDTNQIRAVYNRSAYWAERVEMHQWWSDYLDSLTRGP